MLMKRQGILDGKYNNPVLNHLSMLRPEPKLEGYTKVLWATMIEALLDNDFCDPSDQNIEKHDSRQYFMCYMRNVPKSKGPRYYEARKELEARNMIAFYKKSPSIYLINPEYHPWLRPAHRRAIIEEMKSLSLGFIQKDMYDQYFNEKDQ